MKVFHPSPVAFYYHGDNPRALVWYKKIQSWIKRHFPRITTFPVVAHASSLTSKKQKPPKLVVVLGGDGAILEAVQTYYRYNPLFIGLNLGHVGFLSSVRKEKDFLQGLAQIFKGKYHIIPRMMLKIQLIREGKTIFSSYALNDIAVQNLYGIVNIGISVDSHPIQRIRGTGVLVSTATGSTAYNLSAHGPIVMPDIKCMIITELLDHNLPTPSLIIKRNRVIELSIDHFRAHNRFKITGTNEEADVILAVDAEEILALRKGDRIHIQKSDRLVRFAELEKNYFFKSLHDTFLFH